MPHFIIEYSQELNSEFEVESLMSSVFNGAVQSSLFSTADIKIRAIPFQYYYAKKCNENNNIQQRFIHVCCKMLSGRNLEQRQHLSKLILSELVKQKINSVSMSVEIVDMERESYNKQITEPFNTK